LRAAAALLSLVVGRAAVGAVEVVVLLAQLLVLVPRVAEGGGAHLTSCPLFLKMRFATAFSPLQLGLTNCIERRVVTHTKDGTASRDNVWS
jgi:hypothetical protein